MTKDYSLGNIKLLSDIPEEKLNLLGQRCKWRRFEPEELILNLNDQSTEFTSLSEEKFRLRSFLKQVGV